MFKDILGSPVGLAGPTIKVSELVAARDSAAAARRPCSSCSKACSSRNARRHLSFSSNLSAKVGRREGSIEDVDSDEDDISKGMRMGYWLTVPLNITSSASRFSPNLDKPSSSRERDSSSSSTEGEGGHRGRERMRMRRDKVTNFAIFKSVRSVWVILAIVEFDKNFSER